ncbi:HpcH/HpaI aldolase family protein [Sphingobium sp. R-7]|uniref:HpcH/HpaI aldolase family protein n=1 Tax=Sphingobium sp. R-7 TaxID=3375449 RepID=UPI00398A6CB6
MMHALSTLNAKIESGLTPLGIFVTSQDPASTTILGDVGFDFVLLDCEHGPIDKVIALHHVRAAQAVGTLVLARVLENSPALIQSFLDIGVEGIVVPHIDDADAARRMVNATRYGPGGRGMCPICHAARYSLETWSHHIRQSNANILAIPLLESQAAVENIAEIAAVDGIEFVKFGPGDLSQDMGLDLSRDLPKLMDAWHHVRDTVKAAGKKTMVPGGFGFQGADVVVRDMDLMLLRQRAIDIVAEHRASTGKTGH